VARSGVVGQANSGNGRSTLARSFLPTAWR